MVTEATQAFHKNSAKAFTEIGETGSVISGYIQRRPTATPDLLVAQLPLPKIPAFMATDLPFRSSWLKALMLLLGPGNLRPSDESRKSVARFGLAYMPHPNSPNTLTAIIADCPLWSPKLINTTRLPIRTMATLLATSTEDRDPTPHRNLETEMRMCLTARPVTAGTLRSMDTEYREGLKVQRHQQMQKAKTLEAIRTKEEIKLVAKAASLNLSVEQYLTKTRKAEGMSSPEKRPKKAKGNDVDDGTPSLWPQAVTPPPEPSPEGTPISRSSRGTGSNRPMPGGQGKEPKVKDAEDTAS